MINFRKSLFHLVNIREEDYVYDDKLPDVTVITNAGNTNALSNITLWSQFLSPSPAVLANQPQYARSQDVVVAPYVNAPTDNSKS